MKENSPSVCPNLFATPSDQTGHAEPTKLQSMFDMLQKLYTMNMEQNQQMQLLQEKIDAMQSGNCIDYTTRIKQCIKERIAELKQSSRKDKKKKMCMAYVAAMIFSIKCPNYHITLPEYNLCEFNEQFDVKLDKFAFSRYVSPYFRNADAYCMDHDDIREHIRFFKSRLL